MLSCAAGRRYHTDPKIEENRRFSSVPYHTVPAQELNTKASEKQLAGCIVFQRFFPARRPTGSPAGEKAFGNLLILYSPKAIHMAGRQSAIKKPFPRRLGAGHDKQMVRPADLCHQWCHKFIVLISLVELFHTVEAATVEAFDAGIWGAI